MSDEFGHAELCASRARIAHHLLLGGSDGGAGDESPGSLDVAVEVFLYLAVDIAGAHEPFHDSVFDRVVGDDGESAAGTKHLGGIGEEVGEHCDLGVDGDAECLEYLGEVFLFVARIEERTHCIGQLGGGEDGCFAALLYDSADYSGGVAEVATDGEYCAELVFAALVEVFGGGVTPGAVHAHVEGCVGAEGESA